MSRRTFLKRCGLAGLGFATPVGLQSIPGAIEESSDSSGYPGPYYVVVNASGGWDTTYLMDPKGVEGRLSMLYAAQANSKALDRVVPFIPKEQSKERLAQQNHIALAAFNPGSLAIDTDKGIRVRPEHIHLALREFAGVQDHAFSRRFPLEVTANEKLQNFWA